MVTSRIRRPIRIGNASGAIGDGIDQIYRLASSGDVDAITADYLAEFNLAWKAIEMIDHPELGYEPNFLEQLQWHNGDAARVIAERKIKVVHNGGALNPRGLAEKTHAYLHELGITTVQVAWVSGDDVTGACKAGAFGELQHLDIEGRTLTPEPAKVLSANAYTGMAGIVLALEQGADIVICGRCCDASPTMGLASWWHGWDGGDLDALAGSLMAGHLIECGAYTTGGNYCGFQEVRALHHAGYPIAEIAHDGTAVITKPRDTNGAITIDTVKAQFLYEIQGPLYLNPDVVARIDGGMVKAQGKDRVHLSGIKGLPPPPTTKLAVCMLGGYQAEVASFVAGLDIREKFALMKSQVLGQLDASTFSTVSIELYGSGTSDPKSQAACTAMIRLFVQAPREAPIEEFRRAVFYNGMQGYCGLHLQMDWRTMVPKRFVRYFPSLIAQDAVQLEVHFVGDTLRSGPAVVSNKGRHPFGAFRGQESYETRSPCDLASFGKTVRRPLGDLVFARSGDKGGNASVGIWVRSAAAWPWLQTSLSSARLIELLADDYKPEFHVERFEVPALWAVHFVVYGILEDGVSSSSRIDGFAKSFGEFIRARVCEVPEQLVREETRRRRANGWLVAEEATSRL